MILASLSDQTVYFFASVLFGAALSAVYEILRSFCAVFVKRTAAVMIVDILFFIVSGIATSLFALPFNKGEVRGFILLAEAAGFLIFHLSLGALLFKGLNVLLTALGKMTKKISKIVKKFFVLLLKFMHFILYNIIVIIDRIKHSIKKPKPKPKDRNVHNEQKRKRKKAPRRRSGRDRF